jgi:UDP-glucose 4-epimerase
MLKDYCGAFGVHSVSLRLFNVAGACLDGELGEDRNPETHLIPLLVEAAAGLKPDFTINGTNHETPDGTCVRDFVHVDDIARGHVLALEALEGGMGAHVYNLGSGKGTSVKDIVAMAQRVTGKEIKTQAGVPRSGDPAILVADSTRAQNRLRWKPEVTDVAQMIASAWKWREHKGSANRAFSQKKPNPFL